MDIEEVRDLADRATSAWSKADAKPYIQRLNMLRYEASLNPETALEPYASKVFGDLLCSVEAASGRVRDKEHWMRIVEQDLYKLEVFGLNKTPRPSD